MYRIRFRLRLITTAFVVGVISMLSVHFIVTIESVILGIF